MSNLIAYGRVVGREVRANRDSAADKLILQVEVTDPDDIQSIQLMNMAGEDANPPDGAQIVIVSIGDAFRVAVATDDGIVPTMNVGERKLYSSDAGVIKAFINLLSDGIIEINGNTDFAVRFTELETAFNQLKSDYNLHTHVSVTSLSIPTAPVPQTTADMSGAKVDEVKLP